MQLFIIIYSQPSHSQHTVVHDDLGGQTGEIYGKYLSVIPREDRTLITCRENIETEEQHEMLQGIFGAIHFISTQDEYLRSAQVEEITLQIHTEKPVERIVTAPTEEIDILRAGQLRDYLGIPGQNLRSAILFRNKVMMKERVASLGLLVPPYSEIRSALDLRSFSDTHGFPIVVKPKTGFGARWTEVLDSPEKLVEYTSEVPNFNCHYHSYLMAEAFIRGKVYQVDGIYFPDSHEPVKAWPSVYTNTCLESALERKVLGSYLLEAGNPITPRLICYAQRVLEGFGVEIPMPFHLEVFLREDDDEIIFCEIASRVGGYVNENWKLGIGIDLEEAFCHLQAGEMPLISKSPIEAPKHISGWLSFPATPESCIIHIEALCPFEYCSIYKPLVKIGSKIEAVSGICSNLAYAYILAESEALFLERSQELMDWFNETLVIELNNTEDS